LKLTDFGLSSKLTTSNAENGNSYVCGTFEYNALEMLERNEDGKAFDRWTLGCCLYELLYQVSPFYFDDKNTIKENILLKDPVFCGNKCSTPKGPHQKAFDEKPNKKTRILAKHQKPPTFRRDQFRESSLEIKPHALRPRIHPRKENAESGQGGRGSVYRAE
jgi:serine/threonine protein kinase